MARPSPHLNGKIKLQKNFGAVFCNEDRWISCNAVVSPRTMVEHLDYDDWSLNGDIIYSGMNLFNAGSKFQVWEFRVSPESMKYQLEQADAISTVKNYHSIKCCSMANYHIQLVEELVNPVSVCAPSWQSSYWRGTGKYLARRYD